MKEEDYIVKWFEGSLSEAEMRDFERTHTYKQLRRMDKALEQFKAPEYNVAAEEQKLPTGKTARVVAFSERRTFLKVAASVAVLIAASVIYFLASQNNTVEIMASLKTSEVLPDASVVDLNVGSKLTYDKSSWESNRVVHLNGEGFFKVAKGSRFDVVTPNGVVSVLGTRFNVKNRGQYFEVACFEGIVKVVANGAEVKLQKDQAWRMMNRSAENTSVASGGRPDWLQGESRFESVPYQMVIKEFERQYQIKVSTSGIDLKQHFTGSFTHSDMELALKSITFPLHLTFEIEEGLVRLSVDQ